MSQVRTAMASSGLSQAELARRVEVDYETLRNWLRPTPRAIPSMEKILAISDAVGMHRLEVLVALEILPQGLSQLATENLGLKREVQDLRDHLQRLAGLSGSPSAAIAQAAITSGQWGVAIWPNAAGPDVAHQVRWLDSVQVVPSNTARVSTPVEMADMVANDPVLGPVIGMASAERRRWPAEYPAEFPLPEALSGPESASQVARYVVPVFAAERAPQADAVGLRAPQGAVLVVGLLDHTPMIVVAALMAKALGWGLAGTGSGRGRAFGPAVTAQGMTPAWQGNRQRNILLADFLRAPQPGYVWSHRGTPVVTNRGQQTGKRNRNGQAPTEPHALVAHCRGSAPTPYIVLLSESDDMLAYEASSGQLRWDLEQLSRFRDELRAVVRPLTQKDNALIIETELFGRRRHRSVEAVVQARWSHACEAAARALVHLLEHHGDGIEQFWARDSEVGAMLGFEQSVGN